MQRAFLSIRDRLDRAGILLSGLCALHCVLSIIIVTALGAGGGLLLAPEIHEGGIVLAILIGLATLGLGMRRHGRGGPLAIGAAGIALMATALAVGHGVPEAVLTIAGVSLVAFAHIRNLRLAA